MSLHFGVHGESVFALQRRKHFKNGQCVVIPINPKNIEFAEIPAESSQQSKDNAEEETGLDGETY